MSRRTLKLLGFPVAIILAALLMQALLSGSADPRQPIEYNHKIHVETAGLNCSDCHLYTKTHQSAGIPLLETCQSCHSDTPISDSPEEAKVLKYVGEENEIPWVRVHTIPDHVYFSHRRHVVGAELDCAVCHGNVAEMTRAITRPGMPLTMEHCMDCHKQRNVSNDCLTCHR